ncbi:hypothetical protein HELRODRAFT_82971, partial [Helobdella robusta]|uniref:GAIN-B domain-containing protein n=1 Tax=Helobdella robusta TaxID=6412 RepID=T1G4Y6_HELRO
SGNWSEDGCRVSWTNETMTNCSCDHMTNFALLMSVDQPNLLDNIIIDTISHVGCIISIVALMLTIMIIAVSWK